MPDPWIPFPKDPRRPKPGDWVLATVEYNGDRSVESCQYFEQSDSFSRSQPWMEVVAWKPEIEPYDGE